MRVLLVLFALIATPFFASEAQKGSKPKSEKAKVVSVRPVEHDAHNCKKRYLKLKNEKARLKALKKCGPVTPPSEDPPSEDPPSEDPPPSDPPSQDPPNWGGTSVIDGTVYQAVSPWPGLAGWVVTLSGPVTASTTTDLDGDYFFETLPGGTYTVCLQIPSGWTELFPNWGPTCTTGFGYEFPLADGSYGQYVDFGMVPQ